MESSPKNCRHTLALCPLDINQRSVSKWLKPRRRVSLRTWSSSLLSSILNCLLKSSSAHLPPVDCPPPRPTPQGSWENKLSLCGEFAGLDGPWPLMPTADEATICINAWFHLRYSFYAPPNQKLTQASMNSQQHGAQGPGESKSWVGVCWAEESPGNLGDEIHGWTDRARADLNHFRGHFFAFGHPYTVYVAGSALHQAKDTTASPPF